MGNPEKQEEMGEEGCDVATCKGALDDQVQMRRDYKMS